VSEKLEVLIFRFENLFEIEKEDMRLKIRLFLEAIYLNIGSLYPLKIDL